jgi:uncharacterized protein YbjT (DUF2867 family)
MLVAVLGASGRTGRHVVRHALTEGHHVRAMYRDISRASEPHPSFDVVGGDPTSRSDVEALLNGADAAISALGPRMGGSTRDLCATASGHVASIASRQPGFRYVVISAAGVRGFPDNTPFPFGVPSMIVRALLGETYRDKDAEASVLLASALEWIVLRPPGLTDAPSKGTMRSDATRAGGGQITRDDLAAFAVRMLIDPTYVRKAPFVSN